MAGAPRRAATPAASSRHKRRIKRARCPAIFVVNSTVPVQTSQRGGHREGPAMTDFSPVPEMAPQAAQEPAQSGLTPAARQRRPRPTRFRCVVCNKDKPARDVTQLDVVRPSLIDRIRLEYPELPSEGYICNSDLDGFRSRYVTDLLGEERGELTKLEQEVIQSLADHETLAENIEAEFVGHRTFGERLSDHLASFGGSWTFIMIFAGVLIVWMAFNVLAVARDQFDPYPFILLN